MSTSPWDPIPWFIGGGVAHAAEAVRIGNYVAMGGDEGVINANDLAVIPTSPASGSVRIRPGAVAIHNKQGLYEAYAGRLLDYDTVPIAATGGTGRTDMIIARVEDPFVPGSGFNPPGVGQENSTQYIRTAVISGVSGDPTTVAAAGYGYSAIALALVKLPPGTSVVTDAHIIDLRTITKLRQQGDMYSVVPVAAADGKRYLGGGGAWITWLPGSNIDLKVPWWAAEVTLKVTVTGAGLGEDSDGVFKQAIGDLRVRFGEKTGPEIRYNEQNEAGTTRNTHVAAGKIALGKAEGLRDTIQTFRLEGRKTGNDASLWADDKTTVIMEWSFRQIPETT